VDFVLIHKEIFEVDVLMEKTFLMVKPDGVQRQLIGQIVSRFEQKGLKLIGAKLMKISEELAQQHYGEHKEKPFFNELVQFITSGPVFAMVWEGENAIEIARQMMGKTNPKDALSGTIRGDSPESAELEIQLFFKAEELVEYDREIDAWIY
jgi:nucleoside-diphosphate kinase